MFTVRILHEMHARLRGSKSLLTLYQIRNKKPDSPSLAVEIAELHPDMNFKVAAFTVSERSSNTPSFSECTRFFFTLVLIDRTFEIEDLTIVITSYEIY